ncbi:MAG TPA: tetratricopeptide repeat protein [Coleofasciculaceae cyanobacterium]|jgi:tetratricopeptide (TPR) repeat protein
MEQSPPVRDGIQVVEEGKRLSECLLWKLQEEFYATAGLGAWDAVPFYPTSNARIGEVYAELILNFIGDCQANSLLDFSQPFYILELATGSGAFSFYVLKELQRKIAYFETLKPLQLCYVMTDFTENIVGDWTKNDKLQPFLNAGILDFAVFRPEEQSEITLTRSGKTLAAGAVKNPVVAIANYFFDSIRQDQFRVVDHQLYEARLTFTRAIEESGLEPDSPVTLGQLSKTESFVPVSLDYYDDEALNQVLRHYTESFQDASILFPIGGFRCIANLMQLSGDKLLLLAADKGFTRSDYMAGHKEQLYTPHHGAFSFMVNFDAISRAFGFQGGFAMTDAGDTSILNMLAGGVVSGLTGIPERTRYYFEENILRKDAANNVNLVRRLANPQRYDELALLRSGMALVQLGNYDPLLLYECSEQLLRGIGESLFLPDYRGLLSMLARVRDNMFVADTRTNFYHELEKIYFRLRCYDECRSVALESLARFGPTAQSLTHLGLCFEMEGNTEAALDSFRQALALEPASETIQAAIARLAG